MTDKVFFHPETGKPLHPVPAGVTIPAGTPFGWIDSAGVRHFGTLTRDFAIEPYSCPHFTAEPVAPPVPTLPTEPGATIRATSIKGETCEVMTLSAFGGWVGVDQDGDVRHWEHEDIADWSPVMVVPNGVGVLDETDKRPVVDASGRHWEWSDEFGAWASLGLFNRGTKAAIDRDHGPLTFADGSAS